MRLPTKSVERACFRSGARAVIGVDEVGMGCLAGPVVVCAAAFTPTFYHRTYRRLVWMRDSKLLTPSQRERFANELKRLGIRHAVGYCYPKTIDRLNIYQAARRAMRRAIARLVTRGQEKMKSIVLVDGPHAIAGLGLPQKPIVKGDRTVFAIACASVLAKVFRDRMMRRYAKRFPDYGFEIHKGYATKLHQARLAVLGPSPIHRRSFRVHRPSAILM